MIVENILCIDAWQFLEQDTSCVLIDVRTDHEWKIAGKPKLVHRKQLLLNSLKLYPSMALNESFISVLLEKVQGRSKKFFLCRYGSRSESAVRIACHQGVKGCFNLIDGFEGNSSGLGWAGSGLPIEF